jgi:hypothetical protein
MSDFCKIFENDKYGQVLVIMEIDTSGNWEVNFVIWFDGGTLKAGLSGFKDVENAKKTFNAIGKRASNEFVDSIVPSI